MTTTATAISLRDQLEGAGHTLTDVLRLVSEYERWVTRAQEYRIGMSANVTTDLLATFLKKHFLLHGAKPTVQQGSYDAHIENAKRFAAERVDLLILLNFFDNLSSSLEVSAGAMSGDQVTALKNKFRSVLELELQHAQPIRDVVVPTLHLFTPRRLDGPTALADILVGDFNDILRDVAKRFPNTRVLDLASTVATVGWARAFDQRFYYRYKSPYSAALCDEFARQLAIATRGGGQYFYKALLLDCDNTLWGGIIGEDLIDGIKLGPNDYPGNIFFMAQHAFLDLQRNGVLLCLCTKNNPADVEEVLSRHPHQVIRGEHVIVKRVNWAPKAENIQQISEELNIGLDSLVFVDDSPFECQAIRDQLPMVRVVQVPRNVFEYPATIRSITELFLGGRPRTAGGDKTAQYRQRALAGQERAKYRTEQEYLASLELHVTCVRDEHRAVPRISELTQKSNQFNLTTKRYTEAEISALMDADDAAVYSLHVRDRFGDSGLTGVAVVHYADSELVVDAFLMSCRVIGRGIEFACWNTIFAHARERGCRTVSAQYCQTKKNQQVEDFFDRLGLTCTESSPMHRRYVSVIHEVVVPGAPHVEVDNVG